MSAVSPISAFPESRRFSTRLPRPSRISMSTAVLVAVTAGGCAGDSQPGAPARSSDQTVAGSPLATRAQVQALVDEYSNAYKAYILALNAPRKADEPARSEVKPPKIVTDAGRFLRWAEKNSTDPLATRILIAIVMDGRYSKDAQTAAQLLARDHLDLAAKDVGQVFSDIICLWPMPVAENWLNAYLTKGSTREARATACVALAYYEKWLAERAKIEMSAEWIERLKINFGKESVQYLDDLDAVALTNRAIKLFDRVMTEFVDVEIDGSRLADSARRNLNELTRLSIGKPAPDIEGDDLDGQTLRLSAHRGKVVVLSFWASWCGPCMAMVPHEQELVKRMKDKPFALLGINGDEDLEAARRAVGKAGITWRSWKSGDGIAARWNVRNWPTIYVLDRNGIIRHKDLSGQELEHAVEALVQEAQNFR
jgi:thiol-disulfide isomerase/thioredoxin